MNTMEGNWYELKLEVEHLDGRVLPMHIATNIDTQGNVNSMEAALSIWSFKTKEVTEQSFVDYVNSKGLHRAFTWEVWLKLNEDV